MPGQADRREYLLVLLLGAAGAGLILLAMRQVWAHAIYTPPRPLPAQDVAVRGQSLIPLAGALAIAALACLAAVIATRGLVRRVVGVLLSVIGIGAVVTATAAVTAAAVLSAASGSGSRGVTGGSTTTGVTGQSAAPVLSGAAGHAVMTGLVWHGAAVAGALAVIVAGAITTWRGGRWPVMSSRFETPVGTGQPDAVPAGATASRETDSASMWESLNRDIDPT